MLDGRIDEANRLVYEVSDSNIAIISCRYHY
ncbi:type II toxin-antitoxin system YoeB family toxin [Nitrosospira multiformis]